MKIFINCPFDIEYKEKRRAIIFTCLYCGVLPQLSQLKDSVSIRVQNIISLIKDCELSIHDLSRVESVKAGELARFNMPFELGIMIGLREGSSIYSNKKCLVVDSDPYRLKTALSDLAGADIESYGEEDQVLELVRIIRNWLYKVQSVKPLPASHIYTELIEFKAEYLESLKEFSHFNQDDIDTMTTEEYIRNIQDWLSQKYPEMNR